MISIVVPVYNVRTILEECVNSIIAQTYDCWELILVDDGSTDGSEKICDNYARRYSNIKTIHKSNNGPSSARNLGIKEANGDWIMFVDSDDRLKQNALEKLFLYAEDFDLVICGYETFPDNCQVSYVNENIIYSNIQQTIDKFEFYYNRGFYNQPWNKLYKRNLIDVLFDETLKLGEDLLFNINYFKKVKKLIVIPDMLYEYRMGRDSSLTQIYHRDVVQIQQMLKAALDELFDDNEEVKVATTNAFLRTVISQIQFLIYSKKITKEQKLQTLREWFGKEYLQEQFVSDKYKHTFFQNIIIYNIKKKRVNVIYYTYKIKSVLSWLKDTKLVR